jgi:hypothetical protein
VIAESTENYMQGAACALNNTAIKYNSYIPVNNSKVMAVKIKMNFSTEIIV